MKSSEKISPMTAYYLRKLIQSNQSQLDWMDPRLTDSANMSSPVTQAVSDRRLTVTSPIVLEKLIFLHQSLLTSGPTNSDQVQEIESQIYEMLGLQRKTLIISGTDSLAPPQKCRDLLDKIYGMVIRMDSLVSPNVTLNYLKKTRPEMYWHSPVSVRTTTGDPTHPQLIINTHFDAYEQWIQSLSHQWDSIHQTATRKQPAIPKPPQAPPSGDFTSSTTQADSVKHHRPVTESDLWGDLYQTAKSVSSIDNTSAPHRTRDLLKRLNAVSLKSAQVIGMFQTQRYLLQSRPTHEWCQMFMISKMGTISHYGNIRELLTHSRLNLVEMWMDKFLQLCESKRYEAGVTGS